MRRLGPAPRLCVASAILALAAAAPLGLGAQAQVVDPAQASTTAAGAAQAAALPSLPAPPENPYSRFEIVSLGSFPIMLFYADFAFDLQRYVSNGFASTYAPWPFKTEFSATLTDSQRLTRLGTALGASFVVGAIDAYLHFVKLKKAQRLREASESPGP